MENKLYLVLKEKLFVNGKGEPSDGGHEYLISNHPVFEYFTDDMFKFDYINMDVTAPWLVDSLSKACINGTITNILNNAGIVEDMDEMPYQEGCDLCTVFNFNSKEIPLDQLEKYKKIISDYSNIFSL